jgi:hypothetical protein
VLSEMIMHLIYSRLVLDVLSCNLLLHVVIISRRRPPAAKRARSIHEHDFLVFAIRIYCTIFYFISFRFASLSPTQFFFSRSLPSELSKRPNNDLITRCSAVVFASRESSSLSRLAVTSIHFLRNTSRHKLRFILIN